jgi:hypothetical protein
VTNSKAGWCRPRLSGPAISRREVTARWVRPRHALFQENDLERPLGGSQTIKTTVCASRPSSSNPENYARDLGGNHGSCMEHATVAWDPRENSIIGEL